MRWPFRAKRDIGTRSKQDSAAPGDPDVGSHFDAGPPLLEHVFTQMQIDAQWSVREPRAFTWWGHKLAQRVRVEAPRQSRGVDVVHACVETDLLNDVPSDPNVIEKLATLNMNASLSALVLDQASGRLTYRCGMYVHPQNLAWTRNIFLHAVSIQADDAHARVDVLAKFLDGGQRAYSSHPASGERTEPDGMLSVVGDCFVPPGQGPSTFSDHELQMLAEMEPHPWVLATAGPGGLTAEFPFTGDMPVVGALMGVRGRSEQAPETALCIVSTQERHPQLGSGVQIRLHLPVRGDARMAAELNLAEGQEWTETHQLGAWCSRQTDVVFVTFVPTAAWTPGLLQNLLFSAGLRARADTLQRAPVSDPSFIRIRPVGEAALGYSDPSATSRPAG